MLPGVWIVPNLVGESAVAKTLLLISLLVAGTMALQARAEPLQPVAPPPSLQYPQEFEIAYLRGCAAGPDRQLCQRTVKQAALRRVEPYPPQGKEDRARRRGG